MTHTSFNEPLNPVGHLMACAHLGEDPRPRQRWQAFTLIEPVSGVVHPGILKHPLAAWTACDDQGPVLLIASGPSGARLSMDWRRGRRLKLQVLRVLDFRSLHQPAALWLHWGMRVCIVDAPAGLLELLLPRCLRRLLPSVRRRSWLPIAAMPGDRRSTRSGRRKRTLWNLEMALHTMVCAQAQLEGAVPDPPVDEYTTEASEFRPMSAPSVLLSGGRLTCIALQIGTRRHVAFGGGESLYQTMQDVCRRTSLGLRVRGSVIFERCLALAGPATSALQRQQNWASLVSQLTIEQSGPRHPRPTLVPRKDYRN